MIKGMESGGILVIKHGALGDFILATGPFKAIRQHHTKEAITLLTAPFFSQLAKDCGWFDNIIIDRRPKLWNLKGLLSLRSTLRKNYFKRVYDLQTSKRSSSYFFLFKRPKPEWSGIARNASHVHINPHRNQLHTLERQAEQLKIAGIDYVTDPDISWLSSSLRKFKLPKTYALIVPGGSAHRSAKRWPAEYFSELAKMLLKDGISPLLIGSVAESEIINTIESAAPGSKNLCGKTDIADIASLARGSISAVGNDTGPMHVIAAAGCPSLVLFSAVSEPSITCPRGKSVEILRSKDLKSLDSSVVRNTMIFR